jgi:hypothetical protein
MLDTYLLITTLPRDWLNIRLLGGRTIYLLAMKEQVVTPLIFTRWSQAPN